MGPDQVPSTLGNNMCVSVMGDIYLLGEGREICLLREPCEKYDRNTTNIGRTLRKGKCVRIHNAREEAAYQKCGRAGCGDDPFSARTLGGLFFWDVVSLC